MCTGDKCGKELVDDMSDKLGFTPEILDVLHDLDADFLKKYNMCNHRLLKNGALSAKTKILMALAVVASKQCDKCVVSQMRSAINSGVTKEEIMEAMDVIFITSGAPAVAACKDALKLLK